MKREDVLAYDLFLSRLKKNSCELRSPHNTYVVYVPLAVAQQMVKEAIEDTRFRSAPPAVVHPETIERELKTEEEAQKEKRNYRAEYYQRYREEIQKEKKKYHQEYYQRHREEILGREKERRDAKKTKKPKDRSEYYKAYYAANREKRNAAAIAWHDNRKKNMTLEEARDIYIKHIFDKFSRLSVLSYYLVGRAKYGRLCAGIDFDDFVKKYNSQADGVKITYQLTLNNFIVKKRII